MICPHCGAPMVKVLTWDNGDVKPIRTWNCPNCGSVQLDHSEPKPA